MSRHDDQRLTDILAAAAAIADHTQRGDLDDGLVFDAVRVRLIEIGEAVKTIDPTCSPTSQISRGWMSPACATSSRIVTSIPLKPLCGQRFRRTCRHSWRP